MLYVSAIAVTVTLGSFLAIVIAGLWFRSGETQAAWGVLWVYSIPSFVVLSALSWLVYVRYRQATSAAETTVIYLGNLLVVLAGGLALTYAAALLW